MGDGTLNEYYALVSWQLEALKRTINATKFNDPATKVILICLSDVTDQIANASAAFYREYQNEVYNLNQKIRRDDIQTMTDEIKKMLDGLEPRIKTIEERRQYKPRIKPSKARFRRT